jgi:hypothetical protein
MKYKKLGIIFLACSIALPMPRAQAFIFSGSDSLALLLLPIIMIPIGFITGGITSGVLLHKKAKKEAQAKQQKLINSNGLQPRKKRRRIFYRKSISNAIPMEIPA